MKRRTLLFASLLAPLTGCRGREPSRPLSPTAHTGAPPPAPEPQGKELVVVILGSSTASGKNLKETGARPEDSWVNRYAAYLDGAFPGARVINLAVPGHGTFEGLPSGSTNAVGGPPPDDAHNVTAALRAHPSALIVNYPSGDVADGFSAEQVLKNLETIARAAAAAGVPLWVATSQPSSKASPAERAELLVQRERTLARFGDHALDFFTPLAGPDGAPKPQLLNEYDHVHPNAEGHRLLFEVVKAAKIPERSAQPPARDAGGSSTEQ